MIVSTKLEGCGCESPFDACTHPLAELCTHPLSCTSTKLKVDVVVDARVGVEHSGAIGR